MASLNTDNALSLDRTLPVIGLGMDASGWRAVKPAIPSVNPALMSTDDALSSDGAEAVICAVQATPRVCSGAILGWCDCKHPFAVQMHA